MSAPNTFSTPFFVMLINNQTKIPYGTIKKAGKYTVGRKSSSKASDIQLDVADHYFSGQHFLLEITAKNEVLLQDNGSVNGTFYFNRKLQQFFRVNPREEILLLNGDIIKAGVTELLIKTPAAAPSPKPNANPNANKTTIVKL